MQNFQNLHNFYGSQYILFIYFLHFFINSLFFNIHLIFVKLYLSLVKLPGLFGYERWGHLSLFLCSYGFDCHCPVKIGSRNRHICWQRYISSFIKGTSLTSLLFMGRHKEDTVSYKEELHFQWSQHLIVNIVHF